jgi:hypothetical protein
MPSLRCHPGFNRSKHMMELREGIGALEKEDAVLRTLREVEAAKPLSVRVAEARKPSPRSGLR